MLRNRLLGIVIAIFAGLGSGYAPKAQAGIPVIDVANLAQAIENMVAWAQQYQQMAQQYQQMRQHYEAITGARNLGTILNNPALRQVVPGDLVDLYNAVHYGNMSAAAREIRDLRKIYDCEDREGDEQVRCRAVLNVNSQSQALARQALETATGRVDQIEALMERINATEDPKAISELQARLQAETAQVANDQNRIAVMRQFAQLEQQQAEQARHEHNLKNLALTDDGLGPR